MNNIIDVFDNCIIALNAIAKNLSYLMGNKAILIIWYRTVGFGSTYTKFHKTSLFN